MTFGIESSNIVGYTQKEAGKGQFIILGAQFEGVAGGTKINDLISGVEGVDYDEEGAFHSTAAMLQIPSESGYDVYYYLNDGYDTVLDDGTTAEGWSDYDGNLVDVEVTPGVAMWLKSVNASTDAVVAGAVPEQDSAEIECPAAFALRANVFPVSIVLNSTAMSSTDIVGVDYDESGDFHSTSSMIQVPSANGYEVYYYLNDGYDTVLDDGTTAAGWCDYDGNLVSDVIPAAQGFWTKGVSGAFTLKFVK